MALCRALEMSPNELLDGDARRKFPSERSLLERSRVFSGSPWEAEVGYCRAMRVGGRIEAAGTTAIRDGVVAHAGDAYRQTTVALSIIRAAIAELGGRMADLTRLRIFVTDSALMPDVARALAQGGFHDILPVMTMVAVKGLIAPGLVVEIEAEAIMD